MRQYSSIEELTLTLALYPTQKQAILEEAGRKFYINDQDLWFVVAEDGNCGVFKKDGQLYDLSQVTMLKEHMIPKNIKKINIPDSVIHIGANAFYSCMSLNTIMIPDSVESIKYRAFYYCESLTSINIPNSVKIIGDYAFYGCTSLESINIPNSVAHIGEEAFGCCESLESINIPDSVKIIGYEAFARCKSLENVVFKGKPFEEVQSMDSYSWGIKDTSIIKCEA